jgi:hypothetical protein
MGFITPWPLTVSIDNQPQTIGGLYRIDEEKLNSIDDESFLKLRKSGALSLAYMQLFSMGRIGVLEQLDRVQQQLTQGARQANNLSVDDFFANAENEILKFS